ncbi:MAG: hypothetical protein AB7Y46_05225 [Armatimonadota bacterium]
MGDAVFRELLSETAAIMRPRVTVDGEGVPATPRYEQVSAAVPARIMPRSTASEDDLLGRMEDITHLAFLEPADLRPSDRLVTRPVATALAEDVWAGASVLPVASSEGFRDGQSVEVGEEERIVTAVAAGALTVAPALAEAHEAGEAVRVLRRFEVIEVVDEAGAGHHLRAVVREL